MDLEADQIVGFKRHPCYASWHGVWRWTGAILISWWMHGAAETTRTYDRRRVDSNRLHNMVFKSFVLIKQARNHERDGHK